MSLQSYLAFATVCSIIIFGSHGFLLEGHETKRTTPLVCPVCNSDSSLDHCSRTPMKTCKDSEVCYMQVFQSSGRKRYFGGCVDNNACRHVKNPVNHVSPPSLVKSGTLVCGECCDDTVCHLNLCREISPISTCMSCQDASSLSECFQEACPGQDCYTQVYKDTASGRHSIFAGCALSQECYAVKLRPLVSSASINGPVLCGECCASNTNCNSHLCSREINSMVTIQPPVTTSNALMSSTFCRACNGETSLAECDINPLQHCAYHQECYMQVFLDNNIRRYYGGCAATNQCKDVQNPVSTFLHPGTQICGECCHDPVCYLSLCQQISLVQNCRQCADAKSMGECTGQEHCPGEVCYLQVFTDTQRSGNRIYAGCALPQECVSAKTGALSISSTAPLYPPICGECCNDRTDCNMGLCTQSVSEVSQTVATTPLTTVTSPQTHGLCLVCNGEVSLSSCSHDMMCGQNEDCYMQVFEEKGVKHYYGGCAVTNKCTDVQSPTSTSPAQFQRTGRLICGECCQDSVCYSSLCRQISNVDFCGFCEDASSISECSHYRQCPGEVCYLQVFKDVINGRNRIYGGCTLPQSCASVKLQALTTNSSTIPSGAPDCGQCCQDRSFCNNALCAVSVSEIPKPIAHTVTTATTTTTTTTVPTTQNPGLCLVCNGETSLQACQQRLCSLNEDCYMQVFEDKGVRHYYGGCGQTNKCKDVQSPTLTSPAQFQHTGRLICGECCQDSVCYSSLCRQISPVGFCAFCEGASSLSECNQFRQCPGEVCYLQVFKDNIHGRNKIFGGCALSQECASVRLQALTTNSSIIPSGAPDCGQCCQDRSFCNNALCAVSAASVPSAMSTTTTTLPTTQDSNLCTVCQGEATLADCNTHSRISCAVGEECYMQVFSDGGSNQYYGGCGQTNGCAHVQSPTLSSPAQFQHQGRQLCGECCQDPVCYSSLCRQISMIDFCAECEDASSLSECTNFKQCPGAACYLQVYKDYINGRNKIFAGCTLPETCLHVQDRSLTSNTSLLPVGLPSCGACCSDRSFCNKDSCSEEVAAVLTTPGSITVTTTKDCPVCQGETSISACSIHTTQECAGDKECYMQVVEQGGTNHYYGGCDSTNNCGYVQAPSPTSPNNFRHQGRLVCGECCNDSSCVNDLCQTISLVDFCFTCDGVDTPAACTRVTQCPGQNCYIQVYSDIITGGNKIYAGCAVPGKCGIVKNKFLPINSSVLETNQPLCGDCCNDRSLCNMELCKNETSNVSLASFVPKGVSCETCENCEFRTATIQTVICPDSKPFCMNKIDHLNEFKFYNKSCVSVRACEESWLETSRNPSCRNYDSSLSHPTPLSCNFCCVTPGCNLDLKPKENTLYKVKCPVCKGEASLDDCSRHPVEECSTKEECYMQVVERTDGSKHFFGGCGATNNCSHVQAPSPSSPDNFRHEGRLVCGECCKGLSCSRDLCRTISFVDVCSVCEGVSSRDKCTHDIQCPGQNCYTQVYRNTTGALKIYAGCSIPQQCGDVKNRSISSSPSVTETDNLICGACCDDRSLCNEDLCTDDSLTALRIVASPFMAAFTTTKSAAPTALTQSTAATTTTVIPLTCEVCSGSLCGIIPGSDPSKNCTHDQPYCLNQIENSADGRKTVSKRCASLDDCDTKWWHETSDKSSCVDFNPTNVYNYQLTCYYCCTVQGCNSDIVPARNTLFIGVD